MLNKFIIIFVGISFIHNFFGMLRNEFSSNAIKNNKPPIATKKKENLPSGFGRYKWGDPLDKFKELKLSVHNNTNKRNVLYKIGDLEKAYTPEMTGYSIPMQGYLMFVDNRLSYLVFQVPYPEREKTIDFLKEKYGVAISSKSKNGIEYKWQDQNTMLKVLQYDDKKTLFIQIAYTSKGT